MNNELKKVSHNGLIPTYETNKKQTDQTKDRTEERKMNRLKKNKPMLKKVCDVGSSVTPEFHC